MSEDPIRALIEKLEEDWRSSHPLTPEDLQEDLRMKASISAVALYYSALREDQALNGHDVVFLRAITTTGRWELESNLVR